MTDDRTGLAFRHETTIAKYRDGEDEPYEVVEGDPIWTDIDGTEITDQDRIARLDAKTRENE